MDKATQRLQQIAVDRHRRLHNAAIEREEDRIVERYLVDIAAYVADPYSCEVAAMREP